MSEHEDMHCSLTNQDEEVNDGSSGLVRSPNPEACLLGLPRELRDMILEPLVIKRTNTITMLPNFQCHKDEISACQPAICSVNKQLRAETLPLFYSANTFTAQLDNEHDLETAKAWLRVIGNENAGRLKQLAMCGWTRVSFDYGFIKRWVKFFLNLKNGTSTIENTEGNFGFKEPSPEAAKSLEELRCGFQRLVDARAGEPFDINAVAELMDGFGRLCTGY